MSRGGETRHGRNFTTKGTKEEPKTTKKKDGVG
jgi:hypothetical protein